MTQTLPYSPFRIVGETVYSAGIIGKDYESNVAPEGVAAQTRVAMENLKANLEKAGSSLSHIVKTTVYLTDIGDFAEFNEAYASFLSEPYPARTCIAVAELPRVADIPLVVEIDVIATIS
jgi:2-iminobutanoate/2-iminopropanoate deaminase